VPARKGKVPVRKGRVRAKAHKHKRQHQNLRPERPDKAGAVCERDEYPVYSTRRQFCATSSGDLKRIWRMFHVQNSVTVNLFE
jgi:hypothetical protein